MHKNWPGISVVLHAHICTYQYLEYLDVFCMYWCVYSVCLYFSLYSFGIYLYLLCIHMYMYYCYMILQINTENKHTVIFLYILLVSVLHTCFSMTHCILCTYWYMSSSWNMFKNVSFVQMMPTVQMSMSKNNKYLLSRYFFLLRSKTYILVGFLVNQIYDVHQICSMKLIPSFQMTEAPKCIASSWLGFPV